MPDHPGWCTRRLYRPEKVRGKSWRDGGRASPAQGKRLVGLALLAAPIDTLRSGTGARAASESDDQLGTWDIGLHARCLLTVVLRVAAAAGRDGAELSVFRARPIRVPRRGRFLVSVAAFIAVAAGCSAHGGSAVDCTGGYATNGTCVLASQITGGEVAAQVEGWSLPPMNSRRLTPVHCTVAPNHKSAVCRGWLHPISQEGPGRWLTVRFRINSEGNLMPVCGQRPLNVLCAN